MKRMLAIFFTLLLALRAVGQAQPDFDVLNMRSGLPESRIRALCQMPDGRMAIATAGTVTIYDGSRFTVYHLHPEQEYPLKDYHGLRSLTCDSAGLVWLRNDGSLYVVDACRQKVVGNVDSLLLKRRLTAREVGQWPVSYDWKKTEAYQYVSRLTDEDISAIVRDSYGGLWVGLKESGIWYHNPARKRQFLTTADTFPYEALYPFCSPRASQLSARYAPSATNCTLDGRTMAYTYLGTRRGLMIIDREDRLVGTLDERDGLSTNNIVALISDHRGDVWAATADGLTRLHRTGRDSFDIVNYGLLDGIDTGGREFRTCQIHRDDTGFITVGFVGGIVTFHPDSITAPRYTFHFPRQEFIESSGAAHQSLWAWWLAAGLLFCLSILTAIVLSRRKRRLQSRSTPTTKKTPSTGPNTGAEMAEEIVQQATERHLSSSDLAFLDQLKTAIETHLGDEDFSVQSLSEMLAMDRTVLYRRMQTLTGVSPSVYIKNIRMDTARRLLRDTDLSVGDIAMKTGFATTKYFSAAFKDAFGMTPNEYRK